MLAFQSPCKQGLIRRVSGRKRDEKVVRRTSDDVTF